MQVFETKPKQWGNSLGITIPKDIVEKEKITQDKKIRVLIIGSGMDEIRKTFGTLKFNKSTQKIMDEIDEGYD